MSYSDLFSKLEQAAAGLALSKAPQYTVTPGQSNPTLDCPYAVVFAQNSGEEDPQHSGNFWAEFQLEVHFNAPTDTDGVNPKAANDLMVQTLFDIFMSTTLFADLNGVAISDFTAMGVRNRNTGFHIVGDEWVNILSLQILCCPTTVYP